MLLYRRRSNVDKKEGLVEDSFEVADEVADKETAEQSVDVESTALIKDAIAFEESEEESAPETSLVEPWGDDLEETTNEDVHWIAYSLLGLTAAASIAVPISEVKRSVPSSVSTDLDGDRNDAGEEEDTGVNASPIRTRAKAAPFFKRVFSSRRSTIARLFLFALCAAGIVALALNSRDKSFDKPSAGRSVASSSLPVAPESVVPSEQTAAIDLSPEETIEAIEFAIEDAPSHVEVEASSLDLPKEVEIGAVALSTELISDENPTLAESPCEEKADVKYCSSEASVELQAINISEIRIGDRVPGLNPEGGDGSDEAAFASEGLCVYTLRVPKADGTFCTAKLLRTASWLDEAPTQIVSAFDGHVFNDVDAALAEMTLLPASFYQNFELEVWIDLEELGCVGWSKVVEIDDTFKYVPGEGNLVTGTFEHVAQDVIDLQIEGQEKPIGCTPTHPFWSVDREEFVPAGELVEGERVRVLNGDTKRVVQKLPRPGPELVYNLEVFGFTTLLQTGYWFTIRVMIRRKVS